MRARKLSIGFIASAVTGAVFGAFAVGFAVASDQGQTISACYQQGSGLLRIVAGPSDCRKSEVALSWNQSGAQGPRGPIGPQGPQGASGNLSLAGQICGTGQSVVGFDAEGDIICSGGADPDPTPGSCTDDAFEPNNTASGRYSFGQLAGGTLQRSATICDTEDWFHVRHAEATSASCYPGSSEDFRATFVLSFTRVAGALELDVHASPTDPPFPSVSGADEERVAVNWSGTCGASDAKDFYIRVYGIDAAQKNGYTLTITAEDLQ